MSRSLSTIVRYEEVSKMLFRHCSNSKGDLFSPIEFLNFSIMNNIHLAAATIRQYKSALVWYFEKNYPDLLEMATERLKDFTSKNKHTNSRRQKKKGYSDQELSFFLEFLFNKIDPNNLDDDVDIWENAYYTILAGSLTGLRPSEWLYSFLHYTDEKIFLIVKNGKATNGRAHGEFRSIDITSLPPEDIQAIYKKIELTKFAILSGHYKSFKAYHKAVSGYLLRANDILFPGAKKTFCAYSCRHQFTSNLKASELTFYEMGAILGHKSIETHRLHYLQKSRSGSTSPSLVKPSIEDVIAVIQLNPQGPKPLPNSNQAPSLLPTEPSPGGGPKF